MKHLRRGQKLPMKITFTFNTRQLQVRALFVGYLHHYL